MSAAAERSAAPPIRSRTSDYLVDINKVLLAMADNELLLNSSELSGGLYEDFSSQEDTLKVGLRRHINAMNNTSSHTWQNCLAGFKLCTSL